MSSHYNLQLYAGKYGTGVYRMEKHTNNVSLIKNLVSSPKALPICGIFAGSIYSFGLTAVILPILLMPLLYALINNTTLNSLLKSLIFFFMPFHAVVMIWILESDISGVASLSKLGTTIAATFSWILIVTVMTLAIIPLALGVYYFKKYQSKPNHLVQYVAVFSLWLVCEFLRSIAFAVVSYGAGGTISDTWNFGSLGLSFTNSPLAFSGSVVGLYGLSAIVLLIAIALYEIIILQKRAHALVIVLSISILVSVSYMLYLNTNDTKSIDVSVLSLRDTSAVSSDISIDPLIGSQKDLIVLPEYSYAYTSNKVVSESYINTRLAPGGVSVDVDAGDQEDWYGTLQFRNREEITLGSQTKELLIPTGEYLPFLYKGIFAILGQSKLASDFENNRTLKKGSPPQVFTTDSVTIGPVACSGILSREAYRTLARNGAEVFTNSASLTIFSGSRAYFDQSLMMAKFHSIANHRPFIQATRAAPSFALNSDGTFALKPAKITNQFSDVNVQTSSTKTIYTVLGEWVLVIASLIVGFLCIHIVIKNKYKRKDN